MASLLHTRIRAVKATTLTPIALQAAGRTQGRLIEWTAEPMRPSAGNWGPSVIYHISGVLQDEQGTVPWTAVLKVSSGTIKSKSGWEADVTALARESAFYDSDLPHAFPSGFRPAHCYAASEHVDEEGRTEYWLWLEDLSTALQGGGRWTLDNHLQATYALGLMGGTFAAPGLLARCAWLGGGAYRRYIERAEPRIRAVLTDRSNPLLRRAFPDASVARLRAWWAAQHRDLATLDRLPQTLCHNDATRHNLYLTTGMDGCPEVVAIDWTAAGLGPIGADAVKLVGLTSIQLTVTADQAADRAERAYERYLAGVQAAGWTGDPRLVRLGFTASMIRIKALILNHFALLAYDDTARARMVRSMRAQGATLEDLADRVPAREALLDRWIQESYSLRDELL